ncbi:hypothetical protein VA7868_04308 [Vibrio aerogenes CECT 7868]|uniref:Isoprenylcysteine carboxyl methyltransferase (ICMT) family protein n=1 Tax=Vibrio aerogenes CECT 7868 TaxID=1216006 RepID=A0A1M6DSI2_9VIBR|nr:isoprenylcysteine carboxylmethyltransferase family protein [Vibrio aerogenes]SHI76207.1 hypothetical protein VA7868_04308 [Vibrio aerogenes CECT 7868]
MNKLFFRVTPVAVFLTAAGLIWGCSVCCVWAAIDLPFRIYVAALSLLSSGYFGLSALYRFFRAKTTINPLQPERASAFVCEGVYKVSRNPMYLGLCILLVGFAYWQENLVGFVFVPGFVIYMNHFQIRPEEQALKTLFGEEYLIYKAQVRRWL